MAPVPILIAAFSGRAAAAAARRAGALPLVADLFADDDTRGMAADVRRVAGDLAAGFDDNALLGALSELADSATASPLGVAYGAGFEDRPELLARIGERWPILGNEAETVAATKDPWRLGEMLCRLGIPHPDIAPLPAPSGWLVKRRGGAGGSHVSGGSGRGEGLYAQQRVRGRSISALFVSNAEDVRVIGFSEQWTAPASGEPFRFGGAAAPADLSADLARGLADAVVKASRALGLIGLNSADFIVGPQGWWLIEINPRLGATLDIFDTAEGALFSAHVAASRGEAPPEFPAQASGRATQVLYAPGPIPRMPKHSWPPWVADRPPAGASIGAQAPLCTILATGDTPCEARRLCRARGEHLLQILGLSQWTSSQASA
jgi:uncharacterized protein